MIGLLKALFGLLVSLTAPLVCLVYRRGWYATPDDTASPFGHYEPFMLWVYTHLGKWVGDYWWHGWRNRAYGLDYAMKPRHFKELTTYADCLIEWAQSGPLRIISVDGYEEYTLSLGFAHIIAGYRLRPIADEVWHNEAYFQQIPFRPINMDARPILSIRFGGRDD